MRAVFIDRDGVINENRLDHVKNWSEFKFLFGTLEALKTLAQSDFKVFVITNQAVINRGVVPQSIVDGINAQMVKYVRFHGGRIDDVLCCPHRPEEDCDCRKPRPGLLIRAARDYLLDLQESYLIGDALSDIDAGQSAGCRTIMVLTGRGEDQHRVGRREGRNGYVVDQDLRSAVERILTARRF